MNKIFDLLVVIILTFRYLGDCIFMQCPKNSLKFHIGKDKEIFSKKPEKPKKSQKTDGKTKETEERAENEYKRNWESGKQR